MPIEAPTKYDAEFTLTVIADRAWLAAARIHYFCALQECWTKMMPWAVSGGPIYTFAALFALAFAEGERFSFVKD